MYEHFQLSAGTEIDLDSYYVASIRRVLARVQAGPERDRWPGSEGAPELIILLLRSAPIPFAAVRGCAEAHAIPLPPVIGAHIGSELYGQFAEEKQFERGYSFMLLDVAEIKEYRAWLDGNKYVQTVVAGMKRDAAAAGVPNPGRIMIYDDFECESGTMYAARHLISRAFPEAAIEQSVPMVNWHEIIDLLLPDLPFLKEEAEYARDFLYQLAKGYRETPAGLAPLDSPQQLRRLGQQERHRKGRAYALLGDVYGDEQLLAFPDQVQKAIRALGRTVDPTPAPRPKTAWLLTGAPGTGKTTVLRKTLALLHKDKEEELGPDGFFTVANENGHGYDLVSLSGIRVPLATATEHNFADPAMVMLPDSAEMTVDRAAVDKMIGETLTMALLGQTAVIDEMGLLLSASDALSERIWWLLEHGRSTLLGTITSHAHPFTDRIKEHPAVELVAVTEENRDTLPVELAERLAGRVQVRGWVVDLVGGEEE